MSQKKPSQKLSYGDFCFREPYSGMSPKRIREHLAERARAQIRRSVQKGVAIVPSRWSWLRAPA